MISVASPISVNSGRRFLSAQRFPPASSVASGRGVVRNSGLASCVGRLGSPFAFHALGGVDQCVAGQSPFQDAVNDALERDVYRFMPQELVTSAMLRSIRCAIAVRFAAWRDGSVWCDRPLLVECRLLRGRTGARCRRLAVPGLSGGRHRHTPRPARACPLDSVPSMHLGSALGPPTLPGGGGAATRRGPEVRAASYPACAQVAFPSQVALQQPLC